jgi:energy-coupling factor transporter ATP-binding protein EcfA2
MTTRLLNAEHLRASYRTPDGREVTAVDDVSFEIADAEFFVLLGPSGGGKAGREGTARRTGATQDPYLHADARRCLARSGRVALRAGRMVMGSIVVRPPEPELSDSPHNMRQTST